MFKTIVTQRIFKNFFLDWRCRSQVDEMKVKWVSGGERGEKRGTGGLLCLLGVGGLRLIEVAGAAVGVVVRHVGGGTVQVEVAAA